MNALEESMSMALWACAAFVQAANDPYISKDGRERLLGKALAQANKAYAVQAEWQAQRPEPLEGAQ